MLLCWTIGLGYAERIFVRMRAESMAMELWIGMKTF